MVDGPTLLSKRAIRRARRRERDAVLAELGDDVDDDLMDRYVDRLPRTSSAVARQAALENASALALTPFPHCGRNLERGDSDEHRQPLPKQPRHLPSAGMEARIAAAAVRKAESAALAADPIELPSLFD